MQTRFEEMSSKILKRIGEVLLTKDEMGERIEVLEKSIGDLMELAEAESKEPVKK